MMYTFIIFKEKVKQRTFTGQDGDFCVFKHILNTQSQSVDYAVKYGDYKIFCIDEESKNVTESFPSTRYYEMKDSKYKAEELLKNDKL